MRWSLRSQHEGLRTRYRPGARINSAFFTVVPWVNVLLLAVVVTFTLGSRAIVPGITAELPRAPFREGLDSGLVFVVNPPASIPVAPAALEADVLDNSLPAPRPQAKQEPNGDIAVVVFFNDDRFDLGSESQRTLLLNATAAGLDALRDSETRAGSALLYVDKRVSHGDVVQLVDLLRTAGVRRINLAVKTN
jgi:biopolymer transport protein ExbD